LEGAGGSASQTKSALTSLISEIGTVGSSFAAGTSPMTIFAQHGLKVTAAVAGMMSGGAGLVRFLGGPWGAALQVAIDLLGTLWTRHHDAATAQDTQKAAANGLEEAMRRLNDASAKNIEQTAVAIQADITATKFARDHEVAVRSLIAASLEASYRKRAEAVNAISDPYNPDGAMGAAMRGAGADRELVATTALLMANASKIQQANAAIRSGEGELALQNAAAMTDRATAATTRYRNALAELTVQFKAVDSTMSPEQYQAQAAALMKARNTALARAQGSGAPRGTGEGTRQPTLGTPIATEPKQKYDEEAKAYQGAQDSIVQSADKAADQRRQIEAQTATAMRQRRIEDLSDLENAAQFRVAMGVETNDQLLAEQERFETRRHEIQMEPLHADIADEEKDGKDPVRLNALNNQLLATEQQYQQKMSDLARKRELERTQIQRQAIASTTSLWSQNIARLATLQQGFGATLRGIYSGMVDIVSTALSQMLQKWIKTELSKTTAALTGSGQRVAAETTAGTATTGISALTAIKQVAHSAAVAAARVYASIAQIPIVGPILAPAAAAAAAALYGVIRLGKAIFSAKDGMGSVPYDNAPFLLHKNEMVLPANLASPLRAMLQNGTAANTNAPFAANDGGGHSFHYNDYTEKGQSDAQIMAKRMIFAKAVKQAYREGAFAGTLIAF
jgi:hypothetical protein